MPLGADGPVLRIPPNALTGSVTITIQDTGTRSPEGAPIYEFRPEGTRFSKPIEIEMPVPSGTASPAIYWTDPGSKTKFSPLPSSVAVGKVTAWVSHFSRGYVGEETQVGFVIPPTTVTCLLGHQATVAGMVVASADRYFADACAAAGDSCTSYRDMRSTVVTVARFAGTELELLPGTYPVFALTPSSLSGVLPTSWVATVYAGESSATCSEASRLATSGTVTIDSVSPTLSGSYSVTMDDGVPKSGRFSVTPCAGAGGLSMSAISDYCSIADASTTCTSRACL
jgi:hypothetical protein